MDNTPGHDVAETRLKVSAQIREHFGDLKWDLFKDLCVDRIEQINRRREAIHREEADWLSAAISTEPKKVLHFRLYVPMSLLDVSLESVLLPDLMLIEKAGPYILGRGVIECNLWAPFQHPFLEHIVQTFSREKIEVIKQYVWLHSLARQEAGFHAWESFWKNI